MLANVIITRKSLFFVFFFIAILSAGSTCTALDTTVKSSIPKPAVPIAKTDVQPMIANYLSTFESGLNVALGGELGGKMLGKLGVQNGTPSAKKMFVDQWGASSLLENSGLKIADYSLKGLPGLIGIMDAMSGALGKPVSKSQEIAFPAETASVNEHGVFILTTLSASHKLRDEGLGSILKEKQTNFGFSWPETMIKEFGPQNNLTKDTQGYLQNDIAFSAYGFQFSDWTKLTGSASLIIKLANPAYLTNLKTTLTNSKQTSPSVPGVSGAIIYAQKSSEGWIIFGGPGDNTYDLKEPVAAIIDISGNDTYKGLVASSQSESAPNSLVIDFEGDDNYNGKEFGLATGRLGTGFLLDLSGDDTYTIKSASGGAGFFGVGILCDVQGNDKYIGGRMTQGIAFSGIGLLCDLTGNDTYTSQYMSIGYAGPGGCSAVLDVAGNDSYQCGKSVPSGYNGLDGSQDPNNPKYQYDAFGMGMGMGRRVLEPVRGGYTYSYQYSLAGGIGMVIDVAGNDNYDSSNFSQACGYFYGCGLKLDLAGDDNHKAARYGMASIPHMALGVMIDYTGKDRYSSTGPTWNCGCAWDYSVACFIDAGTEDDVYDLASSGGPCIAFPNSWGFCGDYGGNDTYNIFEMAVAGVDGTTGIAFFYDKSGTDTYKVKKPVSGKKYADKQQFQDGRGGMFWDK